MFCRLSNKKKVNEYLNYKPYYYDGKKTQVKECTICLDDFTDGNIICILSCYRDHIFHEKCMIEWLWRNPICPICRAPAELL